VGLRLKVETGDRAPDFVVKDIDGRFISSRELYGNRNILIFFSRYIGCSWCQMFIVDLIKYRKNIENLDCEVIVITESPTDAVREYRPEGIFFYMVSDQGKELYSLFGVKKKGRVFTKGVITKSFGFLRYLSKYIYVTGGLKGDTYQVPAVFIIGKDGIVKYVFISDDIASHPPVPDLIKFLSGLENKK